MRPIMGIRLTKAEGGEDWQMRTDLPDPQTHEGPDKGWACKKGELVPGKLRLKMQRHDNINELGKCRHFPNAWVLETTNKSYTHRWEFGVIVLNMQLPCWFPHCAKNNVTIHCSRWKLFIWIKVTWPPGLNWPVRSQTGKQRAKVLLYQGPVPVLHPPL